MTRDDIIRMAREAGISFDTIATRLRGDVVVWDAETDHLERFAALVAAAEREAFAKIVDEFCYGNTKVLVEKAIRARGNSETA